MSSLPYLDIHTHKQTSDLSSVGVGSLSVDDIHQGLFHQVYSSAGIHPWWLEDYTAIEIESLQKQISELALANRLWAIGETGIDRAYPEFLEEQFKLFEWHLGLSEKYHLPLIIHSVRSGSDFLGLLKTYKPQMPWIFHDFRGSLELMHDLLRLHPETYFSFGLSLDNSEKTRQLMPSIPLDHLFLETDAQKHLDIHDIHLRASEALDMDLDFLKSQLWLNFKRITTNPFFLNKM